MQSGQVCPNCGEYASSPNVLDAAFHCSYCGHESRDEEAELKLAPLDNTVRASRSLEDYASFDPTMAISRLKGRSCHACGQRMLPKESRCSKCGARYSDTSVLTSAARLQQRLPNTANIYGDTGNNLTQVIDAIRELLAARRDDRRDPNRGSPASGLMLALGSALSVAMKLVLVVSFTTGAFHISPALGMLVLAVAWRTLFSNQPDDKHTTTSRRGNSPIERATKLLKENGYPLESLLVLRALPPILQQRDEEALVMMITGGSHLDMQLAGLDSKEFRVPLVRLSTEDQAFVEAQRELPE